MEFPAHPGLTLLVYTAPQNSPAADGLDLLTDRAASLAEGRNSNLRPRPVRPTHYVDPITSPEIAVGDIPIGVGLKRVGDVPSTGPAGTLATRRIVMSFADKVSHKAQELRGRIKRNTGEVTGDRRLENEGRTDEMKSGLKQTGERIKDALPGVVAGVALVLTRNHGEHAATARSDRHPPGHRNMVGIAEQYRPDQGRGPAPVDGRGRPEGSRTCSSSTGSPIVTVCRGCCCGTLRKHPDVDHDAQLVDLTESIGEALQAGCGSVTASTPASGRTWWSSERPRRAGAPVAARSGWPALDPGLGRGGGRLGAQRRTGDR